MANEETADYGPLQLLIGTWKGDKGMDIAPQEEGQEENPYYETIVFERAGDVENAGTQTLAIVRYHLSVREKANNETSHDQVGYWLWDKANKTIIHSLTIPRGVSVIAGGKFEGKETQTPAAFAVNATKSINYAHYGTNISDVPSPAALAGNIETTSPAE